MMFAREIEELIKELEGKYETFDIYPEPYYEILDEPVTDCTEIMIMDGEENRF